MGTNAASPGRSLSKGSVSQISLVPTHAERKVIPQAAGQAKQDSSGCCTYEGIHWFGANCSNFMKSQLPSSWFQAPAAQCWQDESLFSLNLWAPQDEGHLNCQARDRGITVCLQGLKGCDQKEQNQDGLLCLQRSPDISSIHVPHSPLQISSSFSMLWRCRAASSISSCSLACFQHASLPCP